MSRETFDALIQLLIAVVGAGLLVQLLLLRQNRRKIAGDASASEANAASTLSGAAMKMVENAQAKEHEASQRADSLEDRLSLRQREYEERRDRDARELEERAWTIHALRMRIAILENALRQVGVEIPQDPGFHDQHGTAPSVGPSEGPPVLERTEEPDLD